MAPPLEIALAVVFVVATAWTLACSVGMARRANELLRRLDRRRDTRSVVEDARPLAPTARAYGPMAWQRRSGAASGMEDGQGHDLVFSTGGGAETDLARDIGSGAVNALIVGSAIVRATTARVDTLADGRRAVVVTATPLWTNESEQPTMGATLTTQLYEPWDREQVAATVLGVRI
jgi:hypothetical protein